MPDNRIPIALTIAGSDSGAGAGIQADIKTFAAHGIFCASAITLVTAQSTSSVDAVHILPADIIQRQLDSIFSDFVIKVVKIGALGNCTVIETIGNFVNNHNIPHLIVDPVMVSKHGAPLISDDAVHMMSELLFPLSTLVTPNFFEALRITNSNLTPSDSNMELLAKSISNNHHTATLVKGGHLSSSALDVLFLNNAIHHFNANKVISDHTHGTGCTLSSAIASNLYLGYNLEDSIILAKKYVCSGIENSLIYGNGINPLNHLSFPSYSDD